MTVINILPDALQREKDELLQELVSASPKMGRDREGVDGMRYALSSLEQMRRDATRH